MNIYDALKAIVEVQKNIEISEPTYRKVKTAYLTRPPQNEAIVANLPCWTNSFDFQREERHGALREHFYEVHMQLHVAQATAGDNSAGAEIATAFLEPVMTAFGKVNATTGLGGITLKGDVDGVIQSTVTFTNLRGGSPTLALLDPPGTIGLDLILEIGVADAFDYS